MCGQKTDQSLSNYLKVQIIENKNNYDTVRLRKETT